MRSIGRCVGKFGWQDVSGGVIRELSEADVKGMLLSVAWRNVRDEWRKEMDEKPKLSMMKRQWRQNSPNIYIYYNFIGFGCQVHDTELSHTPQGSRSPCRYIYQLMEYYGIYTA